MASSDNYLEPWFFNSIFPTDPWVSSSDAFSSREAEAITKALTRSISNDPTALYTTTAPFPTNTIDTNPNPDMFFSPSSSSSPADDNALSKILHNNSTTPQYYSYPDPILNHHEIPSTAVAATGSQSISISGSAGSAGSDLESASKRVRATAPAATKGIVKKRKSRGVSKKSTTTFIAADASNFRQMVQQMTGVKYCTTPGGSAGGMVLCAEPFRVAPGSSLPTLDTSAFLLDHHRNQAAAAAVARGVRESDTPAVVNAAAAGTRKNSTGSSTSTSGFDFDSYASCFPTLESFKVM